MQSSVAIYIIVALLIILLSLWAYMFCMSVKPSMNRTQVYELPVYQPNLPVNDCDATGPQTSPQGAPPAQLPQPPQLAHLV